MRVRNTSTRETSVALVDTRPFLPPSSSQTTQSFINLTGSTAYLFVLDARLAGAYLSLVLLFFVFTRLFGARAKRLQKEVCGYVGG